ncbi:unnamed protein product [Fusarium graminearum]|nr:unnamed protein product [Fusarium graminearum]
MSTTNPDIKELQSKVKEAQLAIEQMEARPPESQPSISERLLMYAQHQFLIEKVESKIYILFLKYFVANFQSAPGRPAKMVEQAWGIAWGIWHYHYLLSLAITINDHWNKE